MPDYDLISEDDFFSEIKKNKDEQPSEEKTQDKASPAPSAEDDLFTKPSGEIQETSPDIESEETPDASEEEQAGDFSQDIQESLEIDEPGTLLEEEDEDEEVERPSQEPPLEYEDEKQEKINYKPLIYIFISVVLIVVGYFVVSTFFTGSGQQEGAQQQKTAEQKQAEEKQQGPSAEEIKKKAFKNSLAATTRSQLNFLGDFSSISGKYSRISSILLYDNDLLIQVFSKNRAALAKVNINLKNNFKNQKIEIISSDERPGGRGVLGLFKVRLAPEGTTGTTEVTSPLQTPQAAQQWLEFLADNSNLKFNKIQYRSIGEKDNFMVYELSASAQGKLDNCLKLLSAISSSAKNIKIHKLNLTAGDQKTFNANKYQLKLIIRIYA